MRDVVIAELITNNLKEDSGDFTGGIWDQKYRLRSGKEVKAEAEMKNKKWWNNDLFWLKHPLFDYETMDIPYRKDKNEAQLHIVVSTCRNFAFLVSRYSTSFNVSINIFEHTSIAVNISSVFNILLLLIHPILYHIFY
jgi:hypothetical protein